MRRLMPIVTAVRVLVSALSVLILVNLLIVVDVVPGEWLWYERADHPADLAAFERLNLALLLFALVLTLARQSALRSGLRLKETAFGLWLFCFYLIMTAVSSLSDGFHPAAALVLPINLAMAFTTAQLAIDDGDDDGR